MSRRQALELRHARPLSPEVLVERLADTLAGRSPGHPLRVALDGPLMSDSPLRLAEPLAAALRLRGRPVVVVDAAGFLRPASLRLERGRDDPDAFYEDWLDVPGLQREALGPLAPGGDRRYLPALWDAGRDRATRAGYEVAPADAVALVRGWFLLCFPSSFDVTISCWLSPAARARQVPPEVAGRELPAYDRYDEEARPTERADVVVRCDDPRHPAVIWRLV